MDVQPIKMERQSTENASFLETDKIGMREDNKFHITKVHVFEQATGN